MVVRILKLILKLMLMRKLLALIVVIVLISIGLTLGCTNNEAVYSEITYVGDQTIPELSEGFGLYGSVVEFKGVYPGWEGTVPVTIVNGNDRDRFFTLNLTLSSKVKEGFEQFPEEYFYWISISQPTANVSMGEVKQIPVTISMPEDASYSGKQAEVRIIVADTTQAGLVQIALETKWFIITAD